jgi:hypothetical protein
MKLDRAEKAILESVERGEWRPVKATKRDQGRYSRYAKATVRMDRKGVRSRAPESTQE